MNTPIWKGNGTAVDMWLLQLDLANHSRWTGSLASVIDAFQSRRDFAVSVAHAVCEREFSRLAWAGDGGVFAASSALGADAVVDAASAVESAFLQWRSTAPQGEMLGLRVSAHRARVTTADDPAYCFGSGLNDFMKHERLLSDGSTPVSLVVSAAVYQELPGQAQARWDPLPVVAGTLGQVYRRALGSTTRANATSQEIPQLWFSGACENASIASWGYASVSRSGQPRFVYCYGGDHSHTADYSIRFEGEWLKGSFAWRESPISGLVMLKPNRARTKLKGGWWYAEDVPAGAKLALTLPGMTPTEWVHRPDKKVPEWAKLALAGRRKDESPTGHRKPRRARR